MGLTSKLILVLVFGCVLISAEDDADYEEESTVYRTAMEFVDECGSTELSLCLKERALRYVASLPDELDLGGLKIKPNGKQVETPAPENLPDEPRARENAIEGIIWDKIADYIGSHTLEFKIPVDSNQDVKKEVEEGRGKGGGQGGKGGGGGGRMRGLMMLIYLKAAVLGAIALKFIGLVAFKALLVAKIALTLASIIALKKLLEHKHHTSTYEVVAHPPHHEDWGHYDRSFAQDQAYRGYEGAARSTI